MKVFTGPWGQWVGAASESAITIGVLDGVHRGHRRLIRHLLSGEGAPTVLTFDPHPVEVLAPGTHPRLITTVHERAALLESTGVAQVGVLDLAEIRDLPPERFVAEVLVRGVGMTRLVAGPDFRFAKDRSGDITLLRSMGDQLGFEVEVIDLVDAGGVLSSSRIRGLIETGRVSEAAELLGSFYSMTNVVVGGDKRGRDMGFPTANLQLPERKVIPGDGVYAALATVDGEGYKAAVNVGVRPTFGGGSRVVEAYLLDFEGDLYGKAMTLEFVERLRDELRFDTVDELVARLREDVERARTLLQAGSSVVG